MALDNITESFMRTVSHKRVPLTDDEVYTLVTGVVGSRIRVLKVKISSDTAAKFTLRSSDNIMFDLHGGANWGLIECGNAQDKVPEYICNEGETLTIQPSGANIDSSGIDANIYFHYIVE